MAKMIAVCGLDCADCPARIAFLNNDQALRIKTARVWSELYHADVKPEGINCVGCLQIEGIHVDHCYECAIRRCGVSRGTANCALCDDYACPTISGFIAKVEPAKANLEEIRAAGSRRES